MRCSPFTFASSAGLIACLTALLAGLGLAQTPGNPDQASPTAATCPVRQYDPASLRLTAIRVEPLRASAVQPDAPAKKKPAASRKTKQVKAKKPAPSSVKTDAAS